MPRLRRYLVPALLLLPVIFICGKLLLMPVEDSIFVRDVRTFGFQMYRDFTSVSQISRGWPFVFERVIETSELAWVDPEVPSSEFSVGLLTIDALVLLAAIALAAWLLRRHYVRRGAWLRFSLRELFILTAIVAIAAGWWTRVNSEYQREQNLFPMFGYLAPNTDDACPGWLRRLWLAKDLYHRWPGYDGRMFLRTTSITPDINDRPAQEDDGKMEMIDSIDKVAIRASARAPRAACVGV